MWVVLLKSKSGPALADDLKVILSSERKPERISTDQETV